MANIIKIKRSATTNTPGSLAYGELGWSDEATGNGIGELFIGTNGAGVAKIGSDEILEDGDFSSNGFMRRTGAGVYTNDASIDAITHLTGGNHKIFYTNGSGVTVELTHGASGTVLQSNGATSAPSWETSGSGDVLKVGTPVNNEMAVWTGDGTVEGAATAIYNDAASTTDQMTITANASLTSGSVLKVIGDLAALDAGHLVDLIVDNVGSTSAVLRLQQDGTGDIIQAFDGATEAFTVNQLGKIDVYGGAATTTDTAVLISDGTDIELRVLVAGDLPDLSGTYGDVFKVATPANNEIGVWTGDGTIEGESLFLHDSAVTTGPQLSLTAAASITSGDVLTVTSDDTGHTGNVVNIIQDEATTATANVLRLQQDFTGDILTMFDGASEATTFNQLGKIDYYGGAATTTNRAVLISDGTDMEVRLLVAADIPDLSGTYGDVSGSGATVDNTIVRWSGTGGDTIQESSITISDSGENMAGVGTINTHTIPAGTSTFLIASDIGVSVQAYDATIVVDADIGVTVQGYDADTMFLDQAQTMTALLTLSGDPTADLHAATKQYVDNTTQGFNVKDAVRVCTAASLPAYTQAGAGAGATITMDSVGIVTIDGQDITAANNFAVDDRILVQGDGSAAAADEGIYVVTTLSSAGVALVLTRATDADTTAKLESAYCFVNIGTAYADTSWNQTSTITTVDTTAQTWSQFTSATEHTIANVGTGADVWRDRVGNVDSLRGINAVTNGGITSVVNSNNIDISLDITGMTEDNTDASGATDYVAYYHNTDSAERKVLIDDLLDGGTF